MARNFCDMPYVFCDEAKKHFQNTYRNEYIH